MGSDPVNALVISDAEIDRIKDRIGAWYKSGPQYLSVNQDDIRLYVESTSDSNPLYVDERYARETRFGGLIAPNTFLSLIAHYTATQIGGFPGAHSFHAGNRLEFYRSVRPGDVISPSYRPYIVEEKSGSFAGRMILVDMEILYRNQRDELVGKAHGHVFRLSRESARGNGKYRSVRRSKFTSEDLDRIKAAYAAEKVRGDVPRFWEDVQIGDTLAPIVRGPLRLAEVALRSWHGGGRLVGAGGAVLGAHYYQFEEYQKRSSFAEADDRTGVADNPHRGHWEDDFARKIGVPGAYDIAVQRTAWLASLLTNWAGDAGWMKTIWANFVRFNVTGDTTWAEAEVVGKEVRGREHHVELDVWTTNQRSERSTIGGGVVVLPSRERDFTVPGGNF
jgi:acyl dehydratase